MALVQDAAWREQLRPEVLARLQSLELRARAVVEGFLVGLHRSPFHGYSVEFAEHRQYQPGDEPRLIDWRVYARTERFYVKQFEEETNVRVMLVLDGSASMGFQGQGVWAKWDYAAVLTAALGYLLLRQKDAVGLLLYDAEPRLYRPPSARFSYFGELVRALEQHRPSGQTQSAGALEMVAERLRRRSLVVLIGDLLEPVEPLLRAVRRLRGQHHEVILLQVLDPVELSFAYDSAAEFRDVETGERLATHPYFIRRAYQEAVAEHQRMLQYGCAEHGADFALLTTETPFDRALLQYLSKRRRMQQ
jgi:uncharacterized protein (DUF58 family)